MAYTFYKPILREHPASELPTVEWGGDRTVYEFSRGETGVMTFVTEDEALAARLRALGYPEEVPPKPEDPGAGVTMEEHPPTPRRVKA